MPCKWKRNVVIVAVMLYDLPLCLHAHTVSPIPPIPHRLMPQATSHLPVHWASMLIPQRHLLMIPRLNWSLNWFAVVNQEKVNVALRYLFAHVLIMMGDYVAIGIITTASGQVRRLMKSHWHVMMMLTTYNNKGCHTFRFLYAYTWSSKSCRDCWPACQWRWQLDWAR